MTDRELLELAAKAAGLDTPRYVQWDGRKLGWKNNEGISVESGPTAQRLWNPLTDDGDALRLAVKLGLCVDCSRPSAGEPYKNHAIWLDELMGNEELTRRAIVLAAAEIGKNMQEQPR